MKSLPGDSYNFILLPFSQKKNAKNYIYMPFPQYLSQKEHIIFLDCLPFF